MRSWRRASALPVWPLTKNGRSCATVVLQDVALDSKYERIQELIFVKGNLTCRTEIEIPYYSACNDAICIYCGCDDKAHLLESDGKYPICKTCISKKLLAKDKRTREGHKSKADKVKKHVVGQSILSFVKK